MPANCLGGQIPAEDLDIRLLALAFDSGDGAHQRWLAGGVNCVKSGLPGDEVFRGGGQRVVLDVLAIDDASGSDGLRHF